MPTRTPSSTARQQEWVVLVEAEPGHGKETSLMDVETAQGLLRAMVGSKDDGVVLLCAERVGVQLRLMALNPVMALCTAFSRWRAATERVGPGGWNVVRVEVLTDREFERDVQAGQS